MTPPPPPAEGAPVDLLIAGAALVATCDDDRRELAGGWVAVTDGLVSGVGSAGDRAGRHPHGAGRRMPGHSGPGQHPPPHLPEPHPRLSAGDIVEPVRLAHDALPDLGRARRGGLLPLGVGRAGRAGAGRVHDIDGPPLRAPHRRRRPHHRRDHRGAGARPALPRHPGLDEPLAEGRRPAARLGGAGRRHDPGRVRAPGRPAPPARGRRHDPGGAGPVLAVLGDARAHEGNGRAGRAARRAPAHPPGRGRRRGHVLPRRLRLPSRRVLRGRRLGHRPVLGRPLRLPERRRDRRSSRPGAPEWPTAPARTR